MNAKHEAETLEDANAAEDEALTSEAAGQEPGSTSPDAGDAPGGEAGDLEALRREIEQLRSEVLRARADADNTRKRAERDVEAAHKYGLERFVAELLPVRDSMDMGLSAAADAPDVDTLREGMALTLKMIDDMFEKLGVSEVDPAGEAFNPDFHQAMTMEESTESTPGTVLRVMQKGFLLNERLVRPALVVVAKAPGEA